MSLIISKAIHSFSGIEDTEKSQVELSQKLNSYIPKRVEGEVTIGNTAISNLTYASDNSKIVILPDEHIIVGFYLKKKSSSFTTADDFLVLLGYSTPPGSTFARTRALSTTKVNNGITELYNHMDYFDTIPKNRNYVYVGHTGNESSAKVLKVTVLYLSRE